MLDAFSGYDYVVVPSGSCGGMLKHHLPSLFEDDPNLRARADALAARTHELIEFLTDVRGMEEVTASYSRSTGSAPPARRLLFPAPFAPA